MNFAYLDRPLTGAEQADMLNPKFTYSKMKKILQGKSIVKATTNYTLGKETIGLQGLDINQFLFQLHRIFLQDTQTELQKT